MKYDWHDDLDGDGKLSFYEEYERDDFDDMVAKRGFYAEDKDDRDDFLDDFDDDDEDDDDDDDFDDDEEDDDEDDF